MGTRNPIKMCFVLPTSSVFDQLPEECLLFEDYGFTVKDIAVYMLELWSVINDCAPAHMSSETNHRDQVLKNLGEFVAIQCVVEEDIVHPSMADFATPDEVIRMTAPVVETAVAFYMAFDDYFRRIFANLVPIELKHFRWFGNDLVIRCTL